MVACVFLTSGLNHLKHPAERAKGIGAEYRIHDRPRLGRSARQAWAWRSAS